jgi:hypothetical protein
MWPSEKVAGTMWVVVNYHAFWMSSSTFVRALVHNVGVKCVIYKLSALGALGAACRVPLQDSNIVRDWGQQNDVLRVCRSSIYACVGCKCFAPFLFSIQAHSGYNQRGCPNICSCPHSMQTVLS